MRSQVALLVLVVSVVFIPVPAGGQNRGADRPPDAAAIRAHIESIFQAFVDKDRAKLEATHGAEWRGSTPWSRHVIRGRDGYMNEATFPPSLPKNQGTVGYRIGEFDIVFYGDTMPSPPWLSMNRAVVCARPAMGVARRSTRANGKTEPRRSIL